MYGFFFFFFQLTPPTKNKSNATFKKLIEISTGIKKVSILGTKTEYGKLLSSLAQKELQSIGGVINTTLLSLEEIEDLNKLRNKIKNFSGWKKTNDEKTVLPEPKYDAIFFAGNERFVLRAAPLLAYYDFGPDRLMFLGTSKISTKLLFEIKSIFLHFLLRFIRYLEN